MAYVVPQAQVFQEFNQNPQNDVQHLPAHISGGHGDLIRFEEADEKERGNLGAYDRLADTNFLWPGRPPGATVDQEYTKLFMEDALLLYFTDVIGSGDTISTVAGEATGGDVNGLELLAGHRFHRVAPDGSECVSGRHGESLHRRQQQD